jgi:hypothetical protein
MRQRWLSLVAVMAGVALASAGCDRPSSSITGPTVAGPQFSYISGGFTTNGAVLLVGGGTTTLMMAQTAQLGSAVIGIYGGKINSGATSLSIPAGAVKGATRFTLALRSQPYIAAVLSATDVTTGAVVRTFPVPLTLTLSYAGSKTAVPDPTKLRIYYVVNGVVVEALPVNPDVKGKKLITSVTHFSEYSPGVDVQCDPDPASLNPCP